MTSEGAIKKLSMCKNLFVKEGTETDKAFNMAIEALKAEQPKKGRWRKSLHLSSQKYYMICTCCQYECQGWDGETGVAYDYCPNCGAEMQNGNTNRDYKEDGEQE